MKHLANKAHRDKLKGLFIHVPKTGGTTLGQVFGDEVLKAGHVPWNVIHKRVTSADPAMWEKLFKFAFIRNPYDRHLSWFFATGGGGVFRTVMSGPKKRDFEFHRELFHDWFDPDSKHKHAHEGLRMVSRAHYRPSVLLLDPGEVLKVDYLARWEKFAQEVDYICERLGIEPMQDVRTYNKNPSARRPATGHYSWWYGGSRGEKIRGVIAGLGAWELMKLKYTFESHGESGRPE